MMLNVWTASSIFFIPHNARVLWKISPFVHRTENFKVHCLRHIPPIKFYSSQMKYCILRDLIRVKIKFNFVSCFVLNYVVQVWLLFCYSTDGEKMKWYKFLRFVNKKQWKNQLYWQEDYVLTLSSSCKQNIKSWSSFGSITQGTNH